MNRRAIFLILAIGTLACASRRTLPYYEDRTLTPRWIANASAVASLHRVDDFTLTDQNGRRVTRSDVQGKVYVASFFYASCGQLCPSVRAQLGRVEQAFHDDTMVTILSHTVEPRVDNVSTLAIYARATGIAGRNWHLLTGSAALITRLATDSYFVELSDTTGNTQGVLKHTETILLVDGEGHIRGVYDGTLPYEVDQLIADIRTLREK